MTVVKLSKKAQLDQLIARLTLQTGVKPTQQDVLDAAIELAETHYDELVVILAPKPLLDDQKFNKIMELRKKLSKIEWEEPSRDKFLNDNDVDIYTH
jgi:hypothetical protein